MVYCWGGETSTPTAITSAEPLTSLSGDALYGFCGLTADGLTYCGAMDSPKMGVDQPTLRFTAASGSTINLHRCGLAVDALLYCWRNNDYGQVGVGNQDFKATPARVVGQ
ncbi:hypothetical protein BH11GEM1_BH11GEM1_33540 [soil metagenome]